MYNEAPGPGMMNFIIFIYVLLFTVLYVLFQLLYYTIVIFYFKEFFSLLLSRCL